MNDRMSIVKEILAFLDGKKTIIFGIIATLSAYLAVKNVIGVDEVVLIDGILTILGGGASIATKAIFGKITATGQK